MRSPNKKLFAAELLIGMGEPRLDFLACFALLLFAVAVEEGSKGFVQFSADKASHSSIRYRSRVPCCGV